MASGTSSSSGLGSWKELSVSALSAHNEGLESDEDLASVGHETAYWANMYTGLVHIGRMERPLQAEVINIIGRFVGLSRADTWWALPLGGITCQFCSLTNGGYSDTWTMMGWLIAVADEGSEMMIGHNETVFIETDMF